MKIAIWGCGSYGEHVYSVLTNTKNMCVISVFDTDSKKWGREFGDNRICSPDSLFNELPDALFIAIKAGEERNKVKNNVESMCNIKVYTDIYELVPETVYWDISGFCNAKCKYCITGRKGRIDDLQYIHLDEFVHDYLHLYEHGMISKKSFLGLYNWGEPFLNPDILEICAFLSKENQRYALSTNASIYRKATDKDTYKTCDAIYFSMPGFSQSSYDRIHGFDFETIIKNIKLFRENMIQNGFRGEFFISAHKYRFNEKELPLMEKWAKNNGIEVNSYYPYLAGNTLIQEYFEHKLDEKQVKKDLYLNWSADNDELFFENPLCSQMTINEKGEWTLCCLSDSYADDYTIWGKVTETNSNEEYKQLKKKILCSKSCGICRQYKIAQKILSVNHWDDVSM